MQFRKACVLLIVCLMAISFLGIFGFSDASTDVTVSFVISGSGSIYWQDLTQGTSGTDTTPSVLHSHVFHVGDHVQIQANPSSGRNFQQWKGEGGGNTFYVTANPLNFWLNDISFMLTAYFVTVSNYVASISGNLTGVTYQIVDYTSGERAANNLAFNTGDLLVFDAETIPSGNVIYDFTNDSGAHYYSGAPFLMVGQAASVDVSVRFTTLIPESSYYNITMYYDDTKIFVLPARGNYSAIFGSTFGFSAYTFSGYTFSSVSINNSAQSIPDPTNFTYTLVDNEDNYNVTILTTSTTSVSYTLYDIRALNGVIVQYAVPIEGGTMDTWNLKFTAPGNLAYLDDTIWYHYVGHVLEDGVFSSQNGVFGVQSTGLSYSSDIATSGDYSVRPVTPNTVSSNGTIVNGEISFYVFDWIKYDQTVYEGLKLTYVLDNGKSGVVYYSVVFATNNPSNVPTPIPTGFTLPLGLNALVFIVVGAVVDFVAVALLIRVSQAWMPAVILLVIAFALTMLQASPYLGLLLFSLENLFFAVFLFNGQGKHTK